MSPTDPPPSPAWKLWLLVFLCAAFFVWILSKVIHNKKSFATRRNQEHGATDNTSAAFDEPETIDIANLRRFFFRANALPLRMLGAILFSVIMRGLYAIIIADNNQLPSPELFIAVLVLVIAGLTALTWSARSYWHIMLVIVVLMFTDIACDCYLIYSQPNIQNLDAVAIYAQVIGFFLGLIVYGVPLFIIRAIRNRLSPKPGPGHCQSCGYNLQGLTTPRCPECGQPFSSTAQSCDPEPLVPPT